ncbi:MAG: patatin-like phospholipase family protein [Syntrophaceae bacterium]|nr:patatin-like phospholipase family protein [Syntrophaceae bacterium]
MTRRALVLSGGGAKGSFQIGVLDELILNRGLDFEILCGVSVGALNASFLAQAPFDSLHPDISLGNLKKTFITLRHLWLEEIIGNESVYLKKPGGDVGIVLGADSIYDPEPLTNLLKKHLNPRSMAKSNRILRIQYVSLESGKLQTANNRSPKILDWVLASGTMPYYFPPVEIRKEHFVDGGIRDITPLGQAFQAGAEAIYVIYASPFEVERQEFVESWTGMKINAFTYLGRAVELMINEIYRTDIEGAKRLNTLKENWEKVKGLLPEHPSRKKMERTLKRVRYAPIVEIQPVKYIIRDALDFSPVKLKENYQYGKKIAASLPRSLP